MFHTLAQDCADRLIGTGPRRSNPAWSQVYRALDHGFAKHACGRVSTLGFPHGIDTFANAFERLQGERHRADYDPDARFGRAEVLLMIAEANYAIEQLRACGKQDRTAFAALVLLKRRNH